MEGHGGQDRGGGQAALQAAVDEEVHRYLLDAKRRINALAAERLRELSELSQAYVRWVEETRRRLDELQHALEVGADEAPLERIRAALADAGEPALPGPAAPAVDDAPRDDPVDAAQLVATQMALEGATRAEVERYLREEFGLEETEPILEGAFGQARKR